MGNSRSRLASLPGHGWSPPLPAGIAAGSAYGSKAGSARYLADQNAAKVVAQSALSQELPVILRDWLENPDDCVRMAANAKQFAPYNAAQQVADACEALTRER